MFAFGWALPRSAPFRLERLALLTGALVVFGCAGSQEASLAWPEQPSPSYPSASTDGLLEEESPLAQEEPAKVDKSRQRTASSSALAKQYESKKPMGTLRGKATYYADSLAGNHTANGDVYDPAKFTAAHRNLPFGTVVRVVHVESGAETYVRVNDRGPFGSKDRIIDLSKAAARELDMLDSGVVGVRIEILEKPSAE